MINSITSSIFAKAVAKPSKIWARSRALRNSNNERRVTTSRRWRMKAPKISFNPNNLGWPSTIATILMPNTVCICVCLYRLFKTTSGTSPRFKTTTIRIPSLSDSSRKAEIPSIFLSLTSSAIFSNNLALLTWYGNSLTTILCCPVLSSVSISARARM